MLAGCANIPQDRAATLIAGVQVTKTPSRFDYSYLMFQEYDPASEELLPNGRKILLSRDCRYECKPAAEVQQSITSVWSGYYVLRGIGYNYSIGARLSSFETDFYGVERVGPLGLWRNTVNSGSIKGTKLLRYQVLPGDNLYIGDLSIDFSQTPSRIEKMGRNDRSALDALAIRKLPNNQFYFHPPTTQTPKRA